MAPTPPMAVIARVTMSSLACALGAVQVSSTWGERRPVLHAWRGLKAGVPHIWKTTNLPGPTSGKF